MSETQTLCFRIGADFGITLMQIANEHLLYSNDLDKALLVFTDSLGGEVPKELVLQLLSGEQIILVDEKNQMFNVVERAKYPHLDNIYPKQIDFNKFVVDKQEELDNNTKSLDRNLDLILNKFRYEENYRLDIPTKTMMKYIYGNDDEFIDELMDELQYNDELQQIKHLVKITNDFIEKSVKLNIMIKRLNSMYDIQTDFDIQYLLNLVEKIQEIAKANFIIFTEGDDKMLNSYLEASKKIDAVIETGIEPVDIMDNYNAGWLSPEGDYYALNGEIANMLHIQISNALQEKGLIPKHKNNNIDYSEINPDAWLEQQGWVKIHGNNIQFGGCLNNKLDKYKPNVNITSKQIEIIRDYITECHTCIIKVGWKLERISIGMFTAMAMRDPLALNKKYFSFD